MKHRVYRALAVAFVLAVALTAFVGSGSAARPDPFRLRDVQPNPYLQRGVHHPDPFVSTGVRMDPYQSRSVRDAF